MKKLINMTLRKVSLIYAKFSHLLSVHVSFIIYILLLIHLDYKTGFGGQFGVQKDRVDKSAVGWEHHEKVDKHESQKGFYILSFLFVLGCLFSFVYE